MYNWKRIRNIGKIIHFELESITSISLVKILSIRVAVCCVILLGFSISGMYDDVSNCSRNLLAKSHDLILTGQY